MEGYAEYKETGIEWANEIPINWETRYLQTIATKERYSFTGGPFGSDLKSEEYTSEGVRIIQLQNIGVGRFLDKYKIYTSEEKADELASCNIFPNEIIVAKMADPVARACIMPEFDRRYLMASDGIRIKPDVSIANPRFIVFSVNSPYFRHQAELNSEGTTRLRIGLVALRKLKIFLPPVEEQTQIVNYLDTKTAEIDNIIAAKKKLIELYEEEKAAIINQAVTKGINPDVKLKPSGVEWLGDIPEHWNLKKLKYVANVQTGRTPRIQGGKKDYFLNGEINWYTPADFKSNTSLTTSKRKINEEAIEHSQVELFPELSIYLVSIGATLGKVAISDTKASANQQINVLSILDNQVNPYWVFNFIVGNKEMILNEADYTTLPILNQSKLKNIIFVCPEKEEQTLILRHIDSEQSRINSKIEMAKKLIELLSEYRTTLISEVVTGKLKVTV